MPLPRYEPMLASSGPIRGRAEDFAFEPKLDGWRALVYVDAGVRVLTRHGNDITGKVPELTGLADALAGRRVVLDGELVAHDGTPGSFYKVMPRMASGLHHPGRPPERLTFVAFDLLHLDGGVTATPYLERRSMLEDLGLAGPGWCTAPSYVGLGAELFAACADLGLEGLVAKRLDSPYEPGKRSRHWVKAKCPGWYERHAAHRRPRV